MKKDSVGHIGGKFMFSDVVVSKGNLDGREMMEKFMRIFTHIIICDLFINLTLTSSSSTTQRVMMDCDIPST